MIGHSMGGMLAARYALTVSGRQSSSWCMVNPLGLEDWKAEGVPYASVDQAYRNELETELRAHQKAYQLKFYYNNRWKPEYDRWVAMLAGMYAGAGRERVAWNQALTSDMIFTQPVVHEFGRLRVPTLLMIGGTDRALRRAPIGRHRRR